MEVFGVPLLRALWLIIGGGLAGYFVYTVGIKRKHKRNILIGITILAIVIIEMVLHHGVLLAYNHIIF